MKRRIGRILAWIGAITVGVVILLIILVVNSGEDPVPQKTVLEINLEQRLVEYVPDDPVAKLMADDVVVLRDLVRALNNAASDERVVGILARGGSSRMGFAQIQELRDAFLAFRKSGKPAVIFAETFGEFGPGSGGYYLATAFDKVYLQPSGDVGLTGMAMEHPFVKNMLDSLNIGVQMGHRHEYKNAMNLFTETEFTAPHREASEAILNSMVGQMVRAIADAKNKTPEAVRDLVNRGPFMASEALAEGLVDGLVYWDEVRDRVVKSWGEKSQFLSLSDYIKRTEEVMDDGTKVALIYGVGAVHRGKSDYDPTSSSSSMGAETLTKAFRSAVKDADVKAIVFRVDSPGGSYVASDAIWREVAKAKAAGKPVIVSMGSVAGSGGYFVAMNADKIVAQPGTITGSIGVVGGKFVTEEFWKRLGITWDSAKAGDNALIWTNNEFTPEQWAKFQAWLDHVYDDFTNKVAQGRGMSQADAHAVAKGRIWTGEDAKTRGLVDVLGGLETAMGLAREALKLDADEPLNVKVFPKEKTLMELVLEKGLIQTLSNGDVMMELVGDLKPVIQFAKMVGVGQQRQVLEMPEMNVRF